MQKATRALGKIKKHVALIHCSSDLGLLPRKIANILLHNAISYGKPAMQYEIALKDLISNSNYDSNDYKYLKLSLLKLIKTPLELNLFHENFNNEIEWMATTLLSYASIKTDGVLNYGYSPVIHDLIFFPEKYALIDLDAFMELKSQYSVILYENCYRYINIGKTPHWGLEDFRKLMGLEEHEYKEYKDLNKRIIQHAINELHSKTNLNITPTTIRHGRKIAKIAFQIEDKGIKLFKPAINNKLKELFKFNKREIDNLSAKHSNDEINDAIQYVLGHQSYINGQINDPKSYLKAAIKNKYKQDAENSKTNLIASSGQVTFTKSKPRYILNSNMESELLVYLKSNWQKLINTREEELFKSHLKSVEKTELYSTNGLLNDDAIRIYINVFAANITDMLPKEYLVEQNEKVFS